MPISYMAISAFARDHGISGTNFSTFKHVIHMLDHLYLEAEAAADRDRQPIQGGESE